MLRAFVAIEIPSALRRSLHDTSLEIGSKWADNAVRWVPPENIHLTLRFLGDTKEGQVAALRSGLDEIADDESPFALQLDHTGAFPNLRRPRVIWVGLVDAEERLPPLQRLVERLVRSLGWERERGKTKYSPHVTLGRVRPRSRPPGEEWFTRPPASRFTVEGLSLLRSELRQSGAKGLRRN